MNPQPPEPPAEGRPTEAAGSRNEPGSHGPPAELDYELIRLIGQGGYGEVWLVRDKAGSYRACKVVYRESFSHERPYEREYEGIQKFEPVSQASESQVKILHVGRRDQAGYFYYIMELADDVDTGSTIDPVRYVPKTLRSEAQRRGRLPAKECVELGLSLSAALANLHEHGLIHRDIKPANIIFVNGVPRLADIGLVTEADVTVSYVGTGGFIPPEGPTSPQADVYGLGKVLYEISTGKDRLEFPELPVDFGEWSDHELLLELNAVIARACAADVRQRYRSAEELRADLAWLNAGKSVRRAQSRARKWKAARRAALMFAPLALAAAGVIYFLKAPSPDHARPPAAINRIPVPESRRLAETEAQLKEKYRRQLAEGTHAGKLKAAAELLQESATADDPAVELASSRLAARLAAEAGDYVLAMELCEKMAARFEMNILPAKVELLGLASPFARTSQGQAGLADACVAAGFEAVAVDDYADAALLADLAKTSALSSANPHAARQAAFFGAEAARCEREYDRRRPFLEALRENPGDARASLETGKYLCFVKNDWETGLPLMAHGDDASLKTVLEFELAKKTAASRDQIALGDLWWNLAQTKPDPEQTGFRRRARYWYLKGIATATEPEKSRAHEQLLERLNTVRTQSGVVHLSSRVSRGESIDIYSDEIRWKSNRGSAGNKINHVMVGDLKPGTLRVIRNCGATRLLPEDIDFSTARLTVDFKPKKRGRAELQTEADHVHIALVDPRVGSAEFEVTVTFGNPP